MFAFRFVRSRIALTVVLFMAFGFVSGSSTALAQRSGDTNNCGSPCFSNVDDILQGERSLLPVDDLVVSYGTLNFNGSANVNNVLLPTENSDINYKNVV